MYGGESLGKNVIGQGHGGGSEGSGTAGGIELSHAL